MPRVKVSDMNLSELTPNQLKLFNLAKHYLPNSEWKQLLADILSCNASELSETLSAFCSIEELSHRYYR